MRIRRRDALLPLMQLSQLEGLGMPEAPSTEPQPEETVAIEQLGNCVSRVVDRLPDGYRQVYVMREIDGAPAEEVCRKLALSLPAVKSRLHRARAMVREMLDQELCTKLI
jgi:DNA-directed RNA polymerase specialized sigma24 family protein